MAQILHEFPSVPLPICAEVETKRCGMGCEALRRGEGQAAACSLLKDFQVSSFDLNLANSII